MKQDSLVRIDFSLRREVFFVVIGAIIGAITRFDVYGEPSEELQKALTSLGAQAYNLSMVEIKATKTKARFKKDQFSKVCLSSMELLRYSKDFQAVPTCSWLLCS
jgi:hypothetical protein